LYDQAIILKFSTFRVAHLKSNLDGQQSIQVKAMHFLRKRILPATLLLSSMIVAQVTIAWAQASSPNDIIGTWETESHNFKFEVFNAGDSYAARIIFGDRLLAADGKTLRNDDFNPDPVLRGRPLKGAVFLTNLRWTNGARRWENGRFYDASSGRTYSGRAELVNGRLELRGYRGTPLLGQTLVLNRVD
jgi:uncharacterized protein (DUF2147 family)